MMPSLRRRLMVLVSGMVVVGWAATAVFTYYDARGEIGALLDRQLERAADEVMTLYADDLPRQGHSPGFRPLVSVDRIAFEIHGGDGRLLLHSTPAPDSRLEVGREGYVDTMHDGEHWRVFGRREGRDGYWLYVGAPFQARQELAETVASHLMHPPLIAAPLLGLLIWVAVGAGLAPLGRFAAQVQRRTPDNLAPLDGSGAPREVQPLYTALNTLLSRLNASMELERRFTADAAHELRTPLAVIKTQAQVAAGARTADECAHALRNVVSGTDRATRLVEQLLVLARLDPQTGLISAMPTSLSDLARESLGSMTNASRAKKLELTLSASDAGVVAGDAGLLRILLRNLVDNAVCHTPRGGAVDVRVDRLGDEIVFSVTDSGPGIPESERARVFERFYRAEGGDGEGSGLGLSIVRRIADLHQASIVLGTGAEGKGLQVRMVFPADKGAVKTD
jgi:two-component system sensor histidine kinase QseC